MSDPLGMTSPLPARQDLWTIEFLRTGALDPAAGIVFLVAPVLFGFAGIDAWYYWLNGAAVLLVVGPHKPVSSNSPAVAVA